jgi:hypothetical protein
MHNIRTGRISQLLPAVNGERYRYGFDTATDLGV